MQSNTLSKWKLKSEEDCDQTWSSRQIRDPHSFNHCPDPQALYSHCSHMAQWRVCCLFSKTSFQSFGNDSFSAKIFRQNCSFSHCRILWVSIFTEHLQIWPTSFVIGVLRERPRSAQNVCTQWRALCWKLQISEQQQHLRFEGKCNQRKRGNQSCRWKSKWSLL